MSVHRIHHHQHEIQDATRALAAAGAGGSAWSDRSRRAFDAEITHPLETELRRAQAAAEAVAAGLQAALSELR